MPILAEHKEILMSQSINKTLPEWYEYFNGAYSKNSIYGFCYKNKYPIKKLSKEEKSKIQSNNARKYNLNTSDSVKLLKEQIENIGDA